jgi:hypothetical protein
MRKLLTGVGLLAVLGTTLALVFGGAAGAGQSPPQLTVQDGTTNVHAFPTRGLAPRVNGTPPLLYHGGPVMRPRHTFYVILWVPPHLQNGGATSMPASYQNLMKRMVADYSGHGIANMNTEYYQSSARGNLYIQNVGSLGGSYVDTSLYPASGCTDTATPGNCLTDAQIQAEVTKVRGIQGWGNGFDKMFLVFTSSGEGSCFTPASTSCAYVQYCAYHGYFGPASTPTIYSNEPYGNTSVCQAGGVPSPNNNPAADAALTAASHEMSEAITDPELNAWYDSSGYENGDECAYIYGTNKWAAGKANQMWNGHFYELQEEWSNNDFACEQVGPQ